MLRKYQSYISFFIFLFVTPVFAEPADYQRGLADGRRAGATDGRIKGAQQGRERGEKEGYKKGYDRCEAEKKRQEYDRGYTDGIYRGRQDGDYEGKQKGQRDGDINGQRAGDADGIERADRQARQDAYPKGTEKGRREANESDASDKGRQRGETEGDENALSDAIEVDYPKGRSDYRYKKYAEPITNNDEFSQKSNLILSHSSAQLYESNLKIEPFPMPLDANEDYKRGYNEGYRQSYRTEYDRAFNSEYRQAFDRSERNGCNAAKSKSYQLDYDRGKNDGYQRGYRDSYDRAYRLAYDRYYQDAFDSASRIAYNRTYPRAYDRHFEDARAAAYRARYQELFQAAYTVAYDRVYNTKYPIYADQQYRRGENDEAQDFIDRPVRFLAASTIETIENGLFEPGEELRVLFKLRNFSSSGITAKDVKLSIQALQSNGSIISIPEELLVKNLNLKSVTLVKNALSFTLTEAALVNTKAFHISAFYKGVSIGSTQISLNAKYLTRMNFAAPPSLKEGIPTEWLIKIKNESQVTITGNILLQLKSGSNLLEVVDGQSSVMGLNEQEEKVVKFKVIARTSNPLAKIPFIVESFLADKRKVGVFSEVQEVPVINDYKINVISGAQNLKNKGITRLEYSIKNESKRLNPKSLQLLIEPIELENMARVIGPNPQYLKPLAPGEITKFIVPMLIEDSGLSGLIRLTVTEDGRTVVIHQLNF